MKLAPSSAQLLELFLLQQEEDRKKITRELHDEVAQILTAINFKLSMLSRNSNCTSELRVNIIDAQQMLVKSVDKINTFARELYPMILDDLGLVVALESYIKEFMKHSNIRVKFTTSLNLFEISEINKIVLFRVAQESLSNIAKHSKADEVSITIRKIKDHIQMAIRDNGISFKLKKLGVQIKNKQIGIIGIEERVKMVGGDFAITSSAARGTLVKVRIPIVKR